MEAGVRRTGTWRVVASIRSRTNLHPLVDLPTSAGPMRFGWTIELLFEPTSFVELPTRPANTSPVGYVI